MQSLTIGAVEPILLLLLVLVSALAIIAKRLQIAYPIVMVIGGLCLSVVPHIPRVSLNPDVVFLVILPPLLFTAAFHISWREFRRNLISILMLAFGLVSFTVFGSAAAVHALMPRFRLASRLGPRFHHCRYRCYCRHRNRQTPRASPPHHGIDRIRELG